LGNPKNELSKVRFDANWRSIEGVYDDSFETLVPERGFTGKIKKHYKTNYYYLLQ